VERKRISFGLPIPVYERLAEVAERQERTVEQQAAFELVRAIARTSFKKASSEVSAT